MRSRSARSRMGWVFAVALFAVAVLVVAGSAFNRWLRQREVDTVPDQQKIARSLEIIKTSTPADRKVLKVLFYGQSITRSGWEEAVQQHWHQVYPNTVFVVQNRALGGFPATDLLRATSQDIAAFYPDLIVFQVYGDHHDYEKIIRLFRSQTAADIIVQTDHGEVLPDAPCAEGIRLTWSHTPGCVGAIWLHQRMWSDEMSYHKVPMLAKKYGLALEPQRTWWRDYLLRTGVDPQSMLVDGLHPNAQGKAMIAELFDRYLDALVNSWNGQQEDHVQSQLASAELKATAEGDISFDGTRLEWITAKPLPAWPAVTLDGTSSTPGRSPDETDGCYLVSRASSVGSVPEWPFVRRITLHADHTPEDWTATLTNMSTDQKTFSFTVKGSATGDDGSGTSGKDFLSKSGKLEIDAQDWMPARAFALKHTPLPQPFVGQWSVSNLCAGQPEVIDRGDGLMEYRYVLVTGAVNGPHTLSLHGPAGDFADTVEFRSYKPPLVAAN